MVGDGSNDAPALAAADVGIAMAGGTKLATDAADAVIVGDDLTAVAETFDIATNTHRRIRQNPAGPSRTMRSRSRSPSPVC